ncbi:MAG: crossover junction endodeoxyribonuclease RuvC [Thermodesulfobacteriota bacterium]
MRVIGIDPGSRSCGYGVLESNNGDLKHVVSGAITPPVSCNLSKRLKIIYSSLTEIIHLHSPQYMSIEEMFFAKNAKSAIKLGQARGVAILAAEIAGLQIYEYAPTKVKLAVTGSGRAKKFEIMKMVSYVLGIDDFEKSDISDALAIALCHINISKHPDLSGLDIKSRSGRKRTRFTINDITSKR